MIDRTRQQIATIGELLRYVTPVLIAILGYLTIDKLNTIDSTQASQGRQLQAISDRITRLEHIEAEIERLEDRVGNHDTRIRMIEINNGSP